MKDTRYSTEFAATPAKIWPFLEDPERIKQWMVGVVDDRPTSDGPLGVGSTFEMDIREGRRITTYQGEITAYERESRMGIKMVGGCGRKPFTMHADYRLTPLGGGRTRLDYLCRVDFPDGFFYRLVMPLFGLMAKMMIRKFMRNLRGLVERPEERSATT